MVDSERPAVRIMANEFKHDENDSVLCSDRVQVKFGEMTLNLTQTWQNGEELAPIFSGACWAGTMVWQAAIDLSNYITESFGREMNEATVVELGCGMGVPGMIARLMGASQVVLTEQDEMLSLLESNLASNFADDDGIRSAALDWERLRDIDEIMGTLSSQRMEWATKNLAGAELNGARDILEDRVKSERSQSQRTRFVGQPSLNTNGNQDAQAENDEAKHVDFILCADCVFEPLYGESWKALSKVMRRLSNERTTALVSVERRGDDGVPRFLEACLSEGFTIRLVHQSGPTDPAPIELYEMSVGSFVSMREARHGTQN